jgi:hypothetical protein
MREPQLSPFVSSSDGKKAYESPSLLELGCLAYLTSYSVSVHAN